MFTAPTFRLLSELLLMLISKVLKLLFLFLRTAASSHPAPDMPSFSPAFPPTSQVQSLSSSPNAAAQAAGIFTAAMRSACLGLTRRQAVARVLPVLTRLTGRARDLGASTSPNSESLICVLQMIRATFGTVTPSSAVVVEVATTLQRTSASDSLESVKASSDSTEHKDSSEDHLTASMMGSNDGTMMSRSVSMIIFGGSAESTLPRPHGSVDGRSACLPLESNAPQAQPRAASSTPHMRPRDCSGGGVTYSSFVTEVSASTPSMRPRDRSSGRLTWDRSSGGMTCSSLTEGSPQPAHRYREGAWNTELQAAADGAELETERGSDRGASESDALCCQSAGEITGLEGVFDAGQQSRAAAQHHAVDDQAREAALQQLPRSWFNSVPDDGQDPALAVHRYERRGRSGSSVASSNTGFSLPSAVVRFEARWEASRPPAWRGRRRAILSKLLAFGAFAQLRQELEARRALREVVDARSELAYRRGGGPMSIDEHVQDIRTAFFTQPQLVA